jgi:hypothetical protein
MDKSPALKTDGSGLATSAGDDALNYVTAATAQVPVSPRPRLPAQYRPQPRRKIPGFPVGFEIFVLYLGSQVKGSDPFTAEPLRRQTC